jgi:hypothetical protein
VPKFFNCLACSKVFERDRPDNNSHKHCSLECRWRSYVEVPADVEACWSWLGTSAKSGYGVLRVNGKTVTAHRISLFLHGVDIEKKSVLHSCDNRNCVNPLHLRTGNAKDNNADVMNRKRHAWHRWSDEEKAAWIQKIQSGQKQYRLQQICA